MPTQFRIIPEAAMEVIICVKFLLSTSLNQQISHSLQPPAWLIRKLWRIHWKRLASCMVDTAHLTQGVSNSNCMWVNPMTQPEERVFLRGEGRRVNNTNNKIKKRGETKENAWKILLFLVYFHLISPWYIGLTHILKVTGHIEVKIPRL